MNEGGQDDNSHKNDINLNSNSGQGDCTQGGLNFSGQHQQQHQSQHQSDSGHGGQAFGSQTQQLEHRPFDYATLQREGSQQDPSGRRSGAVPHDALDAGSPGLYPPPPGEDPACTAASTRRCRLSTAS